MSSEKYADDKERFPHIGLMYIDGDDDNISYSITVYFNKNITNKKIIVTESLSNLVK